MEVLLILVMYLSLQTNKISSNSLIYSLLNGLHLFVLVSLTSKLCSS
ncbi:CBU_0592 family membrane protein [Poseidonibacter antarcticus]